MQLDNLKPEVSAIQRKPVIIGMRVWSMLVVTTAAVALTSPVFSAGHPTEESQLEEIIVTSRKTEENLQSIPAAISAFTREDLRIAQVEDIGDLQSLVPNLSLHVGDASNAVIYIRGVGQIDALAFSDPGVGVYVDDAYLGRAQGAFLDIVDAQRIEVLRGPQGTLYGRNTIGGAVKYISARPGTEWRGYVEGTYGNHGRADFKTSIGGPLIPDVLLGKFNIARFTRDGYTSNTFIDGDDGDRDTLAWSSMLVFNPSQSFTAQLSADSSDADPDHSNSPAKESACCTFATTSPVPPDADPFELNVNYNTRERTRSKGAALHLDWQVSDALSLKSITAWRELDYNGELDLDGTTNRVFDVFFNVEQDQASQEFQLVFKQNALEAVAGYYWFEENADSFDGVIGPQASGSFIFASVNENKTDSQAVFADLRYALTNALTLNFGGRWTDEEKEISRIADLFPDLALLPPANELDQSDLREALGSGFNVSSLDNLRNDWDNTSFRLALDWQANADTMLYASISEGFKSGGFNGRSNDVLDPGAADPFQAEEAISYEIGVKSELLERMLQLNLAIFHTDHDNLQVQFPTMMALPAFENVGEATIRGAEMEAVYIVSDALSITANLGYLDAEIDEFIEQGIDVTNSRKMVNAPEWDGRVGFNYQHTSVLGNITLSSSYSFRSKTHLTISGSDLLTQSSYGLWDASVELTSTNGSWQFILGGKNLSYEEYKNHGFDLSGFPGVELGYYGAPRTWSLTGRYNF